MFIKQLASRTRSRKVEVEPCIVHLLCELHEHAVLQTGWGKPALKTPGRFVRRPVPPLHNFGLMWAQPHVMQFVCEQLLSRCSVLVHI